MMRHSGSPKRKTICLIIYILLVLVNGQNFPNFPKSSLDEGFSGDVSRFFLKPSPIADEISGNVVGPKKMPGVNFTSIQEALDQSDPGETVYVLSGEYHENLNLSKPGVTLKGVDTGEGAPVVSTAENRSTITITASNCTVDGFMVINSGNQEVETPRDTPVKTQDGETPRDTPVKTRDVGTPIDTPEETQDGETPRDTPEETQDVETPIDTTTENRWIGIAVLSNGNIISNNAITGCKGNGLELSRSNGNTIQGNRISNNGLDGISLSGSSDNILSSNSVTENGMNGLYLQDSDNNIIRGSLFLNNKLEGILLINSNGNLIADNVYDSIREENSKNNIIIDNKLLSQVDISGNADIEAGEIEEEEPVPGPVPDDDNIFYILVHPGESIQKAINRISPRGVIEILSGTYPETLWVDKAGIILKGIGEGLPVVSGNGEDSTITLISSRVTIKNLVVTESGNPHAGVDLNASDCFIEGCRIVDNKGYGVSVSSDGSIITQNTIEDNGLGGILLQSCRNNRIFNNSISRNTGYGINASSSTSNIIFLNNFNNELNAWDSGSGNRWNCDQDISYVYHSRPFSLPLGNYWSDYEGQDDDGNGVGDTPYNLTPLKGLESGSQDIYPLIKPWPFPPLSISGFKFEDCNGNGVRDPNEPGLDNWTIRLAGPGGLNKTTYTDESGAYGFYGLAPGRYTISEERKQGYSQTYPGQRGIHNVTLFNSSKSGADFGNCRNDLCISGFKKDACTDEGIEDWLITLNNSSYTTSVQTGSDGKYEFCRLVPGDYTLTEETPSGYTSTSAVRLSVTLPCEGNLTNINFTNQKLLCINGTKTDGSGRPLPGWNITLTNGSYTKSVLTDGTGKYEFCGLWPDQYRVSEELKDGWINITDKCRDVMLECKDEVVYFKNIPASLLCISGTKINSCTGEGLVGWTIDLKNSTDTVINTTLTDEKGNYSFCGLRPGSYTVCEKLLSGWKNVSPSCVDVELGCAGSEGNDFRNTNTPLLCISGYKLDDRNKTGLEGWEIVLTNATGEVARNTTNAIGYYQFCDLEPGDYDLRETPKAGYVSVEIPGTVKLECKNLTDQNFTNRKTDGKIWTVCKDGSCNFKIIQKAINNASPGDTIEVQSGTYYEHVVVNKTLILQGVDTGSGLPVVDGGGSGGAITLSADGCSLQGFVASNSGSANSGITVSSSSNTVSGNTVSGSNQRGIYLNSSSGNTVSGNTVSGASQHGIYLTSSSNNTISSNTANGNSGSGIYLTTASNSNIVSANTASNNQYGIRLYASKGNTITGNTANNNVDGFRISESIRKHHQEQHCQ